MLEGRLLHPRSFAPSCAVLAPGRRISKLGGFHPLQKKLFLF